jgi:hypothetical protein
MEKGAAMPPFFGIMRNGLFVFLIAICAVSLAFPQSAVKPTPKSVSPARNSPASKASTKKAAKKKTATKTGANSKKSTKTAAAWHPRQMTPTPERYKEIQQALAAKGYLKSEPNGIWDAQSIEALRQFQTDQNLSVTGRISSASLIGLGLGPNASTPGTPSGPTTTPSTVLVPPPPATPEN